jgi:hypothetical protein
MRFAISFSKLFYETQKIISYKNGNADEFDAIWDR